MPQRPTRILTVPDKLGSLRQAALPPLVVDNAGCRFNQATQETNQI